MPGTAGKMLAIIVRLPPETFKTDLPERKAKEELGPSGERTGSCVIRPAQTQKTGHSMLTTLQQPLKQYS